MAKPVGNATTASTTTGGISDEIRSLVITGTPSSLLKALDLIRSRELSSSEFGRMMNAVTVNLLQRVYSDTPGQFPTPDPPSAGAYTKILRDVSTAVYTTPAQDADYLSCTLPFLALLKETRPERFASSLVDLRKAASLNAAGVLALYFTGFALEKMGSNEEAKAAYARALALSKECYPAALGRARIMAAAGQYPEAITELTALLVLSPDNMSAKRQSALAYYAMGDWSRAESAIAEVLQRNSKDGEFILMRAQVLVEENKFTQAQAPLDLYATINPNNPWYLFLRARVQYEGYHNRDAALNYLRSLLALPDIDDTMTVYTVQLLMSSNRKEEQSEGQTLLKRLLSAVNPSLPVISMALSDALRREEWLEARLYVNRLLDERRSSADLLNAYTIEHNIGNNSAALAYARELYEHDPANEEIGIAYTSALIDTGRLDEAAQLIDKRLGSATNAAIKAQYHYLRSRTRTNEDSRLNDLRSSLFENPRNINSLIAMFDIYHRRKDERRAVYYLKQALAIAPNNPQLKQHEKEYGL